MTDDSQQPRTEEEIAATVVKLQAEARKAEAEAEVATLEAAKARLELAKKEHEGAKWRAEDHHHRRYHFDESVTGASVEKCVRQLWTWSRIDAEEGVAPGDMEIIFTSPGGSIFDGFELFDTIQDLRRYGHHITTGTYGMAASMAGVLLQAGDVRWCSQSSWVMIHRASYGAMGQSHDIEDQVAFVKRIEERIIDIYVKRSEGKLTAQKIKRNWDRKDWWLTAEDCLELGVIDSIRGGLAGIEDE
jgi:ATP-dependent Clp protease protease subunit